MENMAQFSNGGFITINSTVKKIIYKFWVMTNLMHSFLMYLFYASTCFEQQVLIIRRSKLY
jgi:hypothetical protein